MLTLQIQLNGYFPGAKARLYMNEVQNALIPRFSNMNLVDLKAFKKEDFETLIKLTAKFLDTVRKIQRNFADISLGDAAEPVGRNSGETPIECRTSVLSKFVV